MISTKLCHNCGRIHKKVSKFTIKDRNMDDKNTIFDGDFFTISLCDECVSSIGFSNEWFDNELDYDYSLEEYIHEEFIYNFINNFPVESQELIYNTDNKFVEIHISEDDWIKFNS